MTKRNTTLLKLSIGACMAFGLAACGDRADEFLAQSAEPVDHYASQALEAGDYATAAAKLEAMDEQDPLAKLNLALAYQNLDRTDEALAIYHEILAGADNRYVVISTAKAPMRVKTIANKALASLDKN